MRVSTQDQRTYLQFVEAPAISQDVQGFLLDTQAHGCSAGTLGFYREKL